MTNMPRIEVNVSTSGHHPFFNHEAKINKSQFIDFVVLSLQRVAINGDSRPGFSRSRVRHYTVEPLRIKQIENEQKCAVIDNEYEIKQSYDYLLYMIWHETNFDRMKNNLLEM